MSDDDDIDNEFNTDMDGVGAGELSNSAATFLFVERVMHFLRGEHISEANQAVVEFAVLIQCGSYIVDMGSMDSRDKYSLKIEEFPPTTYMPMIYKNIKTQLYKAHCDIDGK